MFDVYYTNKKDYLIKNNKFIPLRMFDPAYRQLYPDVMDRLNQFILRQQDIEVSIKEEEQNQDDDLLICLFQ
jgi:hypothetical protein